MIVATNETMRTDSLVERDVEDKLLQLKERMAETKDQRVVEKLAECMEKWKQKQLNIGFCGHFSAGKSSMINRLLKEELLPSSPIPTSANVVTISQGEPEVLIHFVNGKEISIPIAEVERWKEYCVDGEQVERVTIYVESHLLANGLQLLDTPGIDSTDEAHQEATESALHLADVIMFVTDYNHVQSETNFQFIKSLKEKGKILFLIINQIDKHRQEELSLTSYKERVETGLREWGVQVDGILFTSLIQPDHPYNQFRQLERLFQRLSEVKTELINQHLLNAVHVLLDEHGEYLKTLEEKERESLLEHIEVLKERSGYLEDPQFLKEYERSENAFHAWAKEIEDDMHKIMENAIITPYATTQAAQALIESYQQDFKVGWLFSQRKTEAERKNRLEALYDDLASRVKFQIEWHLKELLRKKAEEFQLNNQAFLSALLDWSLTIPKEWLIELIKTDTVSREFVYTYTRELAKKIHALYRQHILVLAAKAEEIFIQAHEERYKDLTSRVADYRDIESLEEQLNQMDLAIASQIDAYKQLLSDLSGKVDFQQDWGLTEPMFTSETNQEQPDQLRKSEQSIHVGLKQKQLLFNRAPLTQTADKLEKAAALLNPITSLASLRRELVEKAERLRQNRFTVCLFGAFSAGKSSFANALLGSRILPVSPNPTTAAINQVLPATPEHPAGSALIKMKTFQQVEEEIKLSLTRLHLAVSGEIDKDLEQVHTVNPQELPNSLKPYYSFLNACRKGFKEAEEQLGTHLQVDEEAFNQYVAVEEKACFVESIQLFHDAYLTSQGIEIIDTPGADSIYSRHTNVTFNFIKHADVILYVTYYNHAFSRADREFLDQLGRVKDQFSLDKMFFLVNAADLAQSEEELEGVMQHVEQNLLQSGIRFPRIYPISSLRAIQGEEESGLEQFEQEFYRFIQEDVSSLLVEAAEQDLQRTYVLLTEMKAELQSSSQLKEQKIAELNQLQEKWLGEIAEQRYPSFLIELGKEINEHMYYIGQRLFFNFQNHFQEAFHPSVLTAERSSKQQLSICLDELLHSLLFQLKEECKATSLRLENFIHRLQDRARQDWQDKLNEAGIILNSQNPSRMEWGLPFLQDHFELRNKQDLEKALLHFKNPKQFFEQGGREKLREALEQSLQEVVQDYLQQTDRSFQAFYSQAWSEAEAELKERLKDELQLGVASRISVLNGEITIAELETIIEQFQNQII